MSVDIQGLLASVHAPYGTECLLMGPIRTYRCYRRNKKSSSLKERETTSNYAAMVSRYDYFCSINNIYAAINHPWRFVVHA